MKFIDLVLTNCLLWQVYCVCRHRYYFDETQRW